MDWKCGLTTIKLINVYTYMIKLSEAFKVKVTVLVIGKRYFLIIFRSSSEMVKTLIYLW